jgi:MFS family permease
VPTPSSPPVEKALNGSRLPALREPNFRLLLVGDSLSHLGDVFEQVARGWLVFELTNSPLALGLTAFSAGLPRLFLGLMAGVLADRIDRRKILFTCAIVGLVVQLIFASLVLFNVIEVWHILAILLVSGVFQTINQVSRQALIPETVPPASLQNAIAIFTTLRGTHQIVGPSLAGVLILVIGVAGVLYINVASFVAMLVALWLMRLPPAPVATEKLGFREDIGRGLLYVWGRRDLLTLILLGLIPIVLVQPYRHFMPVFARDVLGVGPAGYGILMAAPGVGGVLAAGGLALSGTRRRGVFMLGSLFAVSLALFTFAMSTWFVASLFALVVVGMSNNVYRVMNTTLLQLLTPREMMGRVLGLHQTDRGLQPMGALVLGLLASLISAPLALGLSAIACGTFTAAVLVLRPSLHKL